MFLIPVALLVIAVIICKKIVKNMAYKTLLNSLIEGILFVLDEDDEAVG